MVPLWLGVEMPRQRTAGRKAREDVIQVQAWKEYLTRVRHQSRESNRERKGKEGRKGRRDR